MVHFSYVAGYLGSIVCKKFVCQNCQDQLTKEKLLDDAHELLILHRSYNTREGLSHLTAPSPLMVRITDTILTAFEVNIDSLKTQPRVKESLSNIAREEISKTDHAWLASGTSCQLHREFILNHLIKLKIFKYVLWFSRSLRKPKEKKSQKTTNLQHN